MVQMADHLTGKCRMMMLCFGFRGKLIFSSKAYLKFLSVVLDGSQSSK